MRTIDKRLGMREMNKRVLVGMSGGIDSSAVCMLLEEQGYDVIGLTMRMWDIPSHFSFAGQEEPNHVLEARELASRLGIEHYTLDVRSEFRAGVVQEFIGEYLRGRTPNPCVMCNLHFKWHYLLDEADRLGCSRVATGHYARIDCENGIYMLKRGLDEKKDQSYFLWKLGQRELSRTLFPLGNWTKEEIKQYVLDRGYKEKVEKKESMEVCFIEKDYRDFLRTMLPDLQERVEGGFFVDHIGRKLGRHKGFPLYTIGQRKGLEIALGEPAYVTRINPVKNTIRLGNKKDLLASEMLLEDVLIHDKSLLSSAEELSVRIRYRSPAIAAVASPAEGDKWIVSFLEDASAVTPGQSAVFYKGDKVAGGGIIADQKFLKKYHKDTI